MYYIYIERERELCIHTHMTCQKGKHRSLYELLATKLHQRAQFHAARVDHNAQAWRLLTGHSPRMWLKKHDSNPDVLDLLSARWPYAKFPILSKNASQLRGRRCKMLNATFPAVHCLPCEELRRSSLSSFLDSITSLHRKVIWPRVPASTHDAEHKRPLREDGPASRHGEIANTHVPGAISNALFQR